MTHTLARLHVARIEASLIATLAEADTYRDRAMWRRNVMTDVRRLREARGEYRRLWTAYVAARTQPATVLIHQAAE